MKTKNLPFVVSRLLSPRVALTLLALFFAAGVLIVRSTSFPAYAVEASAVSPGTASLSVTPITWNVVGLDSNSPATGPNRFPVGARVCNTGTTVLGNVTANFNWDSANANINLRAGSLSSVSLGSIAVGNCADAYFEAEVNKVSAAYNTTR